MGALRSTSSSFEHQQEKRYIKQIK